MPTPNESVLFDVNDAKIWPFINDNLEAPEYGAAIDVPGISHRLRWTRTFRPPS